MPRLSRGALTAPLLVGNLGFSLADEALVSAKVIFYAMLFLVLFVISRMLRYKLFGRRHGLYGSCLSIFCFSCRATGVSL